LNYLAQKKIKRKEIKPNSPACKQIPFLANRVEKKATTQISASAAEKKLLPTSLPASTPAIYRERE